MKLKQTIFGSETLINPNSRTCINQLCNMITLSPEIHTLWGMGRFILEPVDEPMNPYKQNLRLQWVPPRRSSGNIPLLTDPKSLDETEAKLTLPRNHITGTKVDSGSIISVTTEDPLQYPLPDRDLLRLQCNLIRVMRMAGRAGGDLLETYDSDSEVPSIAATDICQRQSSAHSSTLVVSDRATPATEPSQKISGPLIPKMIHFKKLRKSSTSFLSKIEHIKHCMRGI